MIAVVLLLVGVVGLYRRTDPLQGPLGAPLVAPVALGSGALLLEYAVNTARANEAVPTPLSAVLVGTRTLRQGLTAALVLVAMFWATATVARQRGVDAARTIKLTLPIQPQAVVYSRDRWKAERSIAWLAGCRRLRIRYDRDSERFFAFAMLACDRLCYNRLPGAATARLP